MQAQTPAGDGVRFVPTPARNGRGLVFGIAMAVAALAFGGFWLATGHIADALTWVCLSAGLVMLGIAWSIHRGDRTEMSFIVNSSGVARDAPERTTFTLPWKEVGASRLVHEHHNNTVWFEIDPARPRLFERRPDLAFHKTKTQRPEDPECYRVLINDGTDQFDEVDAALRRFGGRRYAGRTEVTLKEDQERRRKARTPALGVAFRRSLHHVGVANLQEVR